MLGKLIKHDFKSLSRILLPTLLVIFGATILGTLGFNFLVRNAFDSIGNSPLATILNIISGIVFAIAIMGICASFIFVAVVIFYRFYKSCVDNEAYLTFTLPVSAGNILWSKLITAVSWLIIGTLVGFLCMFIFLTFGTSDGGLVNYDIPNAIREFFTSSYLTGSTVGLIVELIFYSLIASVCVVLEIFLALIIGGTVAQKHKLLAGIGFYFAINTVMGIISSIIQYIFVDNMDAIIVSSSSDIAGIEAFNSVVGRVSQYILLPNMIISLLMCVGFFLLASYFMKNKLNLS